MPKAAPRTSGPKASTNRAEPYTKSSPKNAKSDKENVDPKAKTSKEAEDNISDYRDVHLDEVKGEIPCYDNAATVRRKLKKLLTDKSTIPGTKKKWTQASMVGEMQELEKRGHSVPYNRNATGPTARSLGNFLKNSGEMGGGDSPCYYWGYALLEKLRIHNGEKKSKPRLKAEEEYGGGYVREDPSKKRWTVPANGPNPPHFGKSEARGLGASGPVSLPEPQESDSCAMSPEKVPVICGPIPNSPPL